MSGLQVLSVVSEVYPIVKTGGLADVAGALPAALAPFGVQVRTLVPGYRSVMQQLGETQMGRELPEWFGGPGRLLEAKIGGLELFVLDVPHLYDRAGGPYAGPDGRPHGDNALRFAALCRVGASLAEGLGAPYAPDLVHAHDWQGGLVAAYLSLAGGPRPPVVQTVHNLAFQGQYDRGLLEQLGLPGRMFTPEGVEHHGDIGFLKAGLQLADWITTVSPTYAAEICTPEGGMSLDGLLRSRSDRLTGIVNGLDTGVWDPAADPHIPFRYDRRDLRPRLANKAALQARLGLDADPSAPLFGVISRLEWQKGLDLLLQALPVLLDEGGQLALLGSGDAGLRQGFAEAVARHPGRIGCAFGYDEALAHHIQAAADLIVAPSRFEPCGLTQLCALRYGAVPLVSRVGGLADTVIDATPAAVAAGLGAGLQFWPVEAPVLEAAIRRAAALHRDQALWARIQRNGMTADVSWRRPAQRYATLLTKLARKAAPQHLF